MPMAKLRTAMRSKDGTLYPAGSVDVAEDHAREFGMHSRYGAIILPDARDALFPAPPMIARAARSAEPAAAAEASEAEMRGYRHWWPSGWWGDQGYTSECVAYALVHLMEDGPITWHPRTPGAGPVIVPRTLYKEAQRIDEWPGTNYDGTSIRAGAKVLQRHGFIESYHWLFTLEDAITSLLRYGPIVVASPWHAGMENPGPDGFISPTGELYGWHATLWNGVNRNDGWIRGKNSWGRSWGDDGHYRLTFADAQQLLNAGSQLMVVAERQT